MPTFKRVPVKEHFIIVTFADGSKHTVDYNGNVWESLWVHCNEHQIMPQMVVDIRELAIK